MDATIESTTTLAPDQVASSEDAPPRLWLGGLGAGIAWLAAALVVEFWPNFDDWAYTTELASAAGALGGGLLFASVAGRRLPGIDRLRSLAPWLVALALLLTSWEIFTAKLNLLPRPFFAPPQAFLEVYFEDWRRLGECVIRSLLLLAPGFFIGAALGFASGVALGWSRIAGYWGHPILRLIGPLPAIAWLPIAFFAFPSSWSASVFLIALASGIPVAILTWSGVAGVNSAFYDIARTLGASQRFLVLKVAVPAAMPHVFVGLFMGLASSFSVLVVAEMMGVKAGLGWYLQWAQGWAAYGNMYAALLVMAVMCSGLVTLLFKIRDRLLAWQKGLLRW
ncbi:ABC transporter permease [Telmatospirillum siberiense]|uniref:ABC transporter permease n=1 Tax=Telmatospirillum siberiense TaxID=382514 RepID=A0A2N3PX02_9PROT|nr:ABC transporter permease subunit [Telmatospirillum siberiense]PKU24943.1 ABC transporter permease [Telmatospirillum siberiense]